MELSKKERLFLYNQYEILKLLNANNDSEVERYGIDQEILLNGYKKEYDNFVEWFLDDVDDAISKFVWDVLQLHRCLYFSYDQLSQPEKDKIPFSDIQFRGFDGNEEGAHYSYSKFIIEKLGRYEEIRENGKYSPNSHARTLHRYSKMLEKWSSLGVSEYGKLNLEQITQIIGR
jgi:hypothetical protein